MESVAIIGAGWLGLPLGAKLVQAGHTVHGTTTSTEKLELLSEQGLKSHLWKAGTSSVGDLAFLEEVDILIITLPPGKSGSNYGLQLQRLMDEAKHYGVGKLLYTSSVSVYPAENRIVNEEDAAAIISGHSGVSMLKMEELVRALPTLQSTVVRLGGLFGPGRHPGRWMAGRQDVSGARNPVNMVHLDDCIGVMMAIISQNAWGKTYNVVAPEHPRRCDFYEAACKALGMALPTWSEAVIPWKQVSSGRMMAELGYQFAYPNPLSAI